MAGSDRIGGQPGIGHVRSEVALAGLPTFDLLDLFSGIGGFSLGLERTGGFKTRAFCEIEDFPRAVLAKHWPGVPIYADVRTLTADRLRADGISLNAICGGFPCQDLSSAGEKAGIDGGRSGLWSDLLRLIDEIRPEVAIVENVSDLLAGPEDRPGFWFGRVLGDLASIGYDAEWHCIPGASLNAPHIRDRVWVVAYPHGGRLHSCLADAGDGRKGFLADAHRFPMVGTAVARQERDPWLAEPSLDRVVDGVPRALVQPQLRALGNAVIPQIPELIGRAILATLSDESLAA